MIRPIAPLFFIVVFLFLVIASVLMLVVVMEQNAPTAASTTPYTALALQVALLEEGDGVGLRLTFTERLREQITPEVVSRARALYADRTLDALVGTIEVAEDGGTATVFRPGGEVLTTLVLVHGDWLADTLWFP